MIAHVAGAAAAPVPPPPPPPPALPPGAGGRAAAAGAVAAADPLHVLAPDDVAAALLAFLESRDLARAVQVSRAWAARVRAPARAKWQRVRWVGPRE